MAPVSFSTATVLLWAITLYGVLLILSVFAAWAHARQRSRVGARALHLLALANAAAAGAVAPVVVGWILDAPGPAAAVTAVWLVLACVCQAASRLGLREPAEVTVPAARVVRR